MPNPDTAPTKKPTELETIVFLPGLGTTLGLDQSPDGITRRLVDSLNRTKSPRQFLVMSDGREEDFSGGSRTSVRTIAEVNEKGEQQPVFSVYTFHYDRNLVRRFDSSGLLIKLLVLLLSLLFFVPRIARTFLKFKDSKTFSEKFQLVYGGFVMSLLGVYVIVLLVALVELICRALQITIPSSGFAWFDRFSQQADWVAALLTVCGLTWSGLVGQLSRLATMYLCVVRYLDAGERRMVLTGQFDNLLTHISRQGARKIHILSYSFGSVVALDALFPISDKPSVLAKNVASFVSIGCPFDLIRLYWPNYFDRTARADKVPVWYNIYSPEDLLGSNFRNDGDLKDAENGFLLQSTDAVAFSDNLKTSNSTGKPLLVPMNIIYTNDTGHSRSGILAFLFLNGLQAHTSYWEADYEGERTCLNLVVEKLQVVK